MGIVAVSRSRVQEWVQPEPFAAVGVAVVEADGVSPASGATLGAALVDVLADAASQASCLGVAEVDPFGTVESLPSLVADAPVVVDATGSSLTGRLTAAPAEVAVSASADVVVAGECVAGILLVNFGLNALTTVGDAVVSFEYYGNGSFPVFPFRLPLLFVDPQNIQDAAATVVVTVEGVLDAVAGVADAVVDFTGEAGLTVKGNTPILPWFFPVVFDDLPANVLLALAIVSLDMDSECGVEVVGESVVPIFGTGSHVGSAVLPWSFPVALMGAA